jgi:hypothetical protein
MTHEEPVTGFRSSEYPAAVGSGFDAVSKLIVWFQLAFSMAPSPGLVMFGLSRAPARPGMTRAATAATVTSAASAASFVRRRRGTQRWII